MLFLQPKRLRLRTGDMNDDDLLDLVTLEDVLTLFPGTQRHEVERMWAMMRQVIRANGCANDLEMIANMLASTPSDRESMLSVERLIQRTNDIRQLIERRKKERALPH
jgi:hypothetical protein